MVRLLTLVVLLVAAVLAGGVVIGLVVAKMQAERPTTTTVAAPPRFVDEASQAGVIHAYEGDFDFYVGGGVAAFDCNDDRLPDLYFAGGSSPARLFVNRSNRGAALAFEPLASGITDLAAVTGAYPVDIDSDGRADLAVLRHGENVLLRGVGECRFERANEAWSFDGGDAWSTAFSAKWDAGASWPTIAVGNYLDVDRTGGQPSCRESELFRPAANGGFEPPLPLAPGFCTLSMLFSDWDRSGRRDLRISNDRHYYSDYSDGGEQLWRVEPAGTPRLYTAADGWQRLRVFGMGIATTDLTGDGYPEYYLTSQADNKLQALVDGALEPRYGDIALRRGVTAQRPYSGDTAMPSTAWHAEFQDVNNDGFIDLFVAKGNVEAMPDYAANDPSNLFIGDATGSFSEGAIDAGLATDYGRSRGAAVVDLNADGRLDLVVVKRRENVRVYRNIGSAAEDTATARWVAVQLRQSGANRDAIGAWIELRTSLDGAVQRRELFVGGGHVSGQLAPAHFGLAGAQRAEMRVTWPDGSIGDWLQLDAGHVYLVSRDNQLPEVIDP